MRRRITQFYIKPNFEVCVSSSASLFPQPCTFLFQSFSCHLLFPINFHLCFTCFLHLFSVSSSALFPPIAHPINLPSISLTDWLNSHQLAALKLLTQVQTSADGNLCLCLCSTTCSTSGNRTVRCLLRRKHMLYSLSLSHTHTNTFTCHQYSSF